MATNGVQVGDLRQIFTQLLDDKCQVRKLTKSQFRSKIYDVHICSWIYYEAHHPESLLT